MNYKHFTAFYFIAFSFILALPLKLFSLDQFQPGMIIAKFPAGIVNVPSGETSVLPNEETITDENLLSLLSNMGTTSLDLMIPWADSEDSILTSPITGSQVVIHDWARVFVINFDERQDVEEAVSQMKQLESVVYAEPNALVTIDAIPDDSLFGDQWYLQNSVNADFDIDTEGAWDYSKGNNIRIGIIDTGCYVLHEDLANHIWTGGGSETGTPSQNHGTRVLPHRSNRDGRRSG